MIFSFLLLTVLITLFCFLPGALIIRLVKYQTGRLDKIVISLVMGIAGYILLSFVLGYLSLRFLVLPILLITDIVTIVMFLRNKGVFPKLRKTHLLLGLVIIIGVIAQISLVDISGLKNSDGSLNYANAHFRDSFWHIALIYEVARQIPPIHPGFAPELLNNYHFFYNLFASQFYVIGWFDIYDLYARFLPILMSGLLGFSVFILTRKLVKSETMSIIAVFLTYFAGSFGWIVGKGESAFWVSQTFTMLINPPLSLSLPIFLIGLYILYDLYILYEKKQLQYQLWILVIIISLVLTGIKIYAGLLYLGGILIFAIINFLQTKKIKILLLPTIAISGLFIYLRLGEVNDAGNFLTWAPGWFLRAMMEEPDRLGGMTDWILREETYLAHNNWLAIWRYRIVELVIYIVGNLGVRAIGLLAILQVPFFLTAVIIVAMLFPVFFVQNGSIANTIQFFYYALPLMSILTTLFLIKIKNKLLLFITTILLLLLAVPTSVSIYQESLIDRFYIISPEVVKATGIIKEDSDKNLIVLVLPLENTDSLKIGALSGKRIWYADRLMAENTHKNFKEREVEGNKFFIENKVEYQLDFLKKYSLIKYIYQAKTKNYQKLSDKLPLSIVFESQYNILYKIKF